jgi:tetratricopeptide (TPR) repeat protein
MYEEFLAAYDDATDGKDLPADLKKDWDKAKKAAAAKKPAKTAKVEKRKFDEKEQKALLEEAKGWLADAQFNAALWWEGLAQTDKAVADYAGYLQRFKDKKDVPDIHFNIGSVYEKAKRWADAIKTFDTFATLYAKDSRCTPGQLYLARYRQFLDYKQLDDAKSQGKAMDELLKGFAKLPADGKKDPKVVDAYAHARFANLEPQWKAYLDLKVRLATFPKDRGLKEKKLDDLQKAYTEVLNLGAGEWGIAAVTRIGLGYVDFAQTLTDVPAPKKFDEDQKEIFRQQLEEKAQPLEDKAIEAFESALTTAYKLSIYSEWTLLAQERINKYRPGAYPKVREVPFQGSEFFATAPLLKAGTVADAPKTENTPGQPTASRGGGAGAR